jgi:hypothetical protein
MAGETAIAEKQMLPLHTAGYNGVLDPISWGASLKQGKLVTANKWTTSLTGSNYYLESNSMQHLSQ